MLERSKVDVCVTQIYELEKRETTMVKQERQKYERIIHLLREIEYAKSQLAPHDTGHISTAISWMESRVATLTRELNETPANDFEDFSKRSHERKVNALGHDTAMSGYNTPPWRNAARRKVERNKSIYPEDC